MIQFDSGDLFGVAAATTAAVESGLLGALAQGESFAASALATDLGLDPAAVARVLDVLVAARVVDRVSCRYALTAELLAMHRAFPGGLALTAMLYAGTGSYLRSGAGPLAMDGDNAQREGAYRATVGGLAVLFENAAAAFATAMVAELPADRASAPLHILDVGCGSGVWGLSLAARLPAARVSGFDLPAVLEVFLATAAARGLADRAAALPGDMRETSLPTADVVILANVLRLEAAPRAEALIRRLVGAIAPGGTLVVVDALAEGSPDREVARAVYALNLALRTRNSGVHAPEQLRGWFRAAGLTDVRTLDFGVWPGAVAAVVGRR